MSDHPRDEPLVRAQATDGDGCVMRVTPESAGWRYVGFEVYRIAARCAPAARARRPRDLRHRAGWQLRHPLPSRGLDRCWRSRKPPFDGAPAGAYLPPGRHVRDLGAGGAVEVALGHAPAKRGAAARVIRSADARSRSAGAGRRTRPDPSHPHGGRRRGIAPRDRGASRRAVTGRAIATQATTRTDPPRETALEGDLTTTVSVTSAGFALQRVYIRRPAHSDESLAVA